MWFQRASDVMRKMRSGDIDLGIVGYDMFVELGAGDPDLVVVHDSLQFGHCHLAVAVPQGWDHVTSLDELAALPWSEARPMRVVTGYTHIAQQFFAKAGLRHVALSTADGALEAAPAMGSADVILDLVSSGRAPLFFRGNWLMGNARAPPGSLTRQPCVLRARAAPRCARTT